MAKNYEFKPDKPLVGWTSKLHLTKLQRASLLKWGLYTLFLLVLSVVQDVVLCRFRLFEATTELVPCGIFIICLLEGSHVGSLFALISSCLYLFSGTPAGPYSMVLITFLAILLCLFREAFLQEGFAATLLCTVFCMATYEGLNFIAGLLLGLTRLDRWIGFAVTTGLTILTIPILYPIALSIRSIGGESWKE